MTQITMDSQNPTRLRETINQMPNKSKDIKVLLKTQDNLILGSEKLFTKSLTNSFTKLFANEHDIALIPYSNNKFSIEKTNEIYLSLKNSFESGYNKKIFIGHGQDCEMLFDLYVNYGFTFDGAVFINNLREDHEKLYGNTVRSAYAKTKIYNLYGKGHKYGPLACAHVNQLIPTLISPLTTQRYAQEAYGVVLYEIHEKTYLNDTKGKMALI